MPPNTPTTAVETNVTTGGAENRSGFNKVLDRTVRTPFRIIGGTARRVGAVMGTTWDRLATAPGRAWDYLNKGRDIEIKPGDGVLSKIQSWTLTKSLRVLATAGLILTSPVALVGEGANIVKSEAKAAWTGQTQKATPVTQKNTENPNQA